MNEENKRSMISSGIPSQEPDPIYVTKRSLIIMGVIIAALLAGAILL